ncbi:unnamed protein product, partial [Callosobruchus maculatus]
MVEVNILNDHSEGYTWSCTFKTSKAGTLKRHAKNIDPQEVIEDIIERNSRVQFNRNTHSDSRMSTDELRKRTIARNEEAEAGDQLTKSDTNSSRENLQSNLRDSEATINSRLRRQGIDFIENYHGRTILPYLPITILEEIYGNVCFCPIVRYFILFEVKFDLARKKNLPTTLIILNMASNNDYCCVPQCNSWAKKLPQIACAWSGRKSIVSDKYKANLVLEMPCVTAAVPRRDVFLNPNAQKSIFEYFVRNLPNSAIAKH